MTQFFDTIRLMVNAGLILTAIFLLIETQGTPPCESNDNKKECFQYRTDGAWCKDEADDCKDFDVTESRNKDNQYTTYTGVRRIFIMAMSLIGFFFILTARFFQLWG